MATEITFSELDAYATCPFLWWQRYVIGWRPKKKSIKLSFGTAIHKGVEALYNRHEDPVSVVVAYCEEVKRKAEEAGIPLDTEYDIGLRKSINVFRAYHAKYRDDFDRYNVLTVEPTFSIPLVDEIIVSGKIDRIMIEKTTGFFFPFETKTAAQWNPDLNRLMLDFQISLYSWAVSKMLKLHDVTFVYDVVRKPMMRLKRNETEADFLTRIEQEINGDPGKYLVRDKVTRSRREIERTEGDLIIRCRELVEKRRNRAVYRTPGDHCFWKCDYMPPCLEDTPEMWEAMYERANDIHEELREEEEVQV